MQIGTTGPLTTGPQPEKQKLGKQKAEMQVRSEKACVTGGESPPKFGGKAAGVQNESDEWKSLTNCPRPRVAWRKEARQTRESVGSNDR
jgi:hypothetical protein